MGGQDGGKLHLIGRESRMRFVAQHLCMIHRFHVGTGRIDLRVFNEQTDLVLTVFETAKQRVGGGRDSFHVSHSNAKGLKKIK